MKCSLVDPVEKVTPAPRVTVFEVEHSLEHVNQTVAALRGFDCVLYEWLGGTDLERQQAMDIINALGDYQYSDEEAAEILNSTDNFILHLAYALRGEGILFLPIDTAQNTDSPVWQAHQQEVAMEEELGSMVDAISKEDITVNALASYIAQRARTQVLRDSQMVGDVSRILDRIARNNKLSQSISTVGIIVGKAHQSVYEDLYSQNPLVARQQIP